MRLSSVLQPNNRRVLVKRLLRTCLVGGVGSLSLRLTLTVRRVLCQVWDSPVLARVRAALLGLGRWGVV
jgi:hypothetical protein